MGNQGSSNDGTRIMKNGMKGLIDVHTVHAWTDRPVWPQRNSGQL
jgi:hypothetical protein